MEQIPDSSEFSKACTSIRDIEDEQPGKKQTRADIRLENQSQGIQGVFPSLAWIPPGMLGEVLYWGGFMSVVRFLLAGLQSWALEN